MMLMNRYDVRNALDFYTHNAPEVGNEQPNYAVAARVLSDLMSWTDATSDGWPYWSEPSRAAKRLQELLQGWRRRYINGDASDLDAADLDAALRPIKAFLTRQRNDRDGDFLASASLLREQIARAQKLQVVR